MPEAEVVGSGIARPVRIAGGSGRAVRIAGRAKATEDHPGRGSFLRRPLARISGRGIGLHRFDPVNRTIYSRQTVPFHPYSVMSFTSRASTDRPAESTYGEHPR